MKNIKSIEQFLFESKSSAKKRFLDRGLVSEEIFERFLEIDTTPTKKFIEKMCEFFVAGSSEEEVITTFQKATQSKVKFDISTIKSLFELQEILSQEGLTGSRDRVQIGTREKGVEITYEDDRFTVLYITSVSASKKYGSGTTWCISANEKNMFNKYYKIDKSRFYFIYDYKTTNKAWKKLAVEINDNNKDRIIVYNTFDNDKDYTGWENDIVGYPYLIDNIKNFEVAFKYHKNLFDSDAIFKSKYGINGNYTINEDGSIDVDGDVYIGEMRLKEIPIKYNKVTGVFDCSDNQLTTLKNCPVFVGQTFFCMRNKLTSLEYSPIKVGGGFYCSFNHLTSLEGCPNRISLFFHCDDNKLTNLEYSPLFNGYYFDCSNNNLTSLEGMRSEIPTFIGSFDCSNNMLGNLVGFPCEKTNSNFQFSKNNLTSLEGCPVEIKGDFACYMNNLTSLEFAPSEVGGVFSCHSQKNEHKFTEDEIKAVCQVRKRIYV